MKRYPVVLDLETKYTFRQFKEHQKLEVSVAAVYNYADHRAFSYTEKELNQLFPLLEHCSAIIGFNVRSFDLPVLQRYYPGALELFSTFDILDDIREKLGRRLALNDIIAATLGKKKSGHGLMAIDYYKEGKFDQLKQYCLDDVMLTKEIFDYGVEKGEINYLSAKGKETIRVDWKKVLEDNGKKETPLTLPF